MSRARRFTPAHEKIFEMARQAWTLSEKELEQIKPGDDGVLKAYDMLDMSKLPTGHLTSLAGESLDNLPVELLRLMRNPEWFPFTCRNLFMRPDASGPLEILPFQHLALMELWWRQFPMMVWSRGAGKSFILALYALLRATFTPGSKIIITAAAFRQAKQVFEYCERLWANSPVFRTLVNSGPPGGSRKNNGPRRDIDRVEFVVGDSVIIGLPIGNGEKIRGLRANYILTDEVAALNEEIYAVVVQGFASVTADPIGNVKDYARISLLKRLGLWTAEMDAEELKRVRGNQSVLSGTAHYAFNHFCKYWREYRSIIETGGDKDKLTALFGMPPSEDFNWRDYSIMRLSYDMIPHGYMDAKTIERARQITNTGQFRREYGAVFQLDSDGFFRRTLIESCVVGKKEDLSPPRFPSTAMEPVRFAADVTGRPDMTYVYGIDPASEHDLFTIVILERWPDHRRVVYTWSTSKSDHRKKLRSTKDSEHNFYRFCVRKIRDLMKVFPCELMQVDHGGGGVAVREALGDPDKLEAGEMPIYELRSDNTRKPKDTDTMPGLHILELVVFRDNAWVVEANEGLKKDLEDRVLLFPLIDPIAVAIAMEDDESAGRVVTNEHGDKVLATADSLEGCMLEIEALKEELATIVVKSTDTGLSRWDTPDKKEGGSKLGRMRKDRYSALLMANMGARKLARKVQQDSYQGAQSGGFIDKVKPANGGPTSRSGLMYRGDVGFRDAVGTGEGYGRVVLRRGV